MTSILLSRPFAVLGGFTFLAALWTVMAPLWLAVASVFLFAGPHNWMEARYFAQRMPVRWADRRPFFVAAAVGVIALSVSYGWVSERAFWHGALGLWCIGLAKLAGRTVSGLAWAAVCFWISLALLVPVAADTAVVYAHPLVALWFAQRQIARSHPEWVPAFGCVVACLPVLILSLLAASSPVPQDWMFEQASAGLSALPASSGAVAVHAFLELLHYGIWVILLPAIGLRSAPWRLDAIPLVRHRLGFPAAVRSVLYAGAAAVVLLWVCFALDYETTRRLYFQIAVIHVMAEAPFLLWMR